MLSSNGSRSQLQRRSTASLRQSEGTSNLAHELASAIDVVPGDSAKSLAAEFGLDFDDYVESGLPSSSSTPVTISGLERRTPYSSNETIPEYEEESGMGDELDLFDDGVDAETALNPFMSPKVERDPQVELEEALKQTSRVLDALKVVDTVRGKPLEVILQDHLSLLLHVEKTRDEQLRELLVLERELGRVNWDDDLLDALETLARPDEGKAAQLLVDAEALNSVREEEVVLGEGPEEFEGKMLAELEEPSSPTNGRRAGRRKSTSQSPENVSACMQSLHQNTQALVTMLHALSDTLYTCSSMGVSSARQLKGIRAGVVDWRQRDEMEAVCLDKVAEYEAAERLRQERGGERPTEIAKGEMAEFKQLIKQYERRWKTLKTIRV